MPSGDNCIFPHIRKKEVGRVTSSWNSAPSQTRRSEEEERRVPRSPDFPWEWQNQDPPIQQLICTGLRPPELYVWPWSIQKRQKNDRGLAKRPKFSPKAQKPNRVHPKPGLPKKESLAGQALCPEERQRETYGAEPTLPSLFPSPLAGFGSSTSCWSSVIGAAARRAPSAPASPGPAPPSRAPQSATPARLRDRDLDGRAGGRRPGRAGRREDGGKGRDGEGRGGTGRVGRSK